MYIIVAGGGKVGYYLGRALIDEGHEVLIIEKNAKTYEEISERLGSVVVRGDACEAATLADVGTARADIVIAVTGDDEDNLVTCQVAKHKFNVPRTIARIKNPNNETIFKKLGIDVTVSSTNLIMEQIEEKLPHHPLIHLLKLKMGDLEIVDLEVLPDSPVVGKKLKDVSLPANSIISLVINQERGPQVPSGDTIIETGDEVIAVTTTEAEAALRAALTGE